MNAIEQIITELQTLFGAGTVGAYITLGLYGLVVLILLFSLLKGWTRGIYRQASRLITILVAGVGSLFLTAQIYPHLTLVCDGQTVGTLLEQLHLTSLLAGKGIWEPILSGIGGTSLEYLAVLPLSLVALPVLLLVSFLLISFLLLVVHWLVCHVFGWDPYCNTVPSRLAGMVLGALQGCIVALMILIASFHLINSAGTLVAHADEDSRLRNVYETYLQTADESALSRVVAACGGNAVERAFMDHVIIDERPVDVDSMADAMGGLYSSMEKLQGANFKDLTDEQVETLRGMIGYIEQDESLAYLVAGVLDSAAQNYDAYERILPFTDPFLPVLREFVLVFEGETPETVVEDLHTLTEAYIILMDSGVLSEQEDTALAVSLLTFWDEEGMTVLHRVVDILSQNERTAHLSLAVAEYALSILAEDAGTDGTALYRSVASGVYVILAATPDTMDKNSYILSVKEALGALYESQGLYVEDARLEAMAAHIESTYRDVPSDALTEGQMCDIILSYYRSSLY